MVHRDWLRRVEVFVCSRVMARSNELAAALLENGVPRVQANQFPQLDRQVGDARSARRVRDAEEPVALPREDEVDDLEGALKGRPRSRGDLERVGLDADAVKEGRTRVAHAFGEARGSNRSSWADEAVGAKQATQRVAGCASGSLRSN